MDEGFMFLLGFCLGSLMMLFVIVRLIAEMHDQMEQNLRRR